MKIIVLAAVLIITAVSGVAEAAGTYIPIGHIGVPLSTYELSRATFHPVKASNRPTLPGLRPVELELLEDILSKKMPNKVGASHQKAHAKIIRMAFRNPSERGQLLGTFAEALFLEKNPHWGSVPKTNAPQNDVYTRIQGRRPPYNGQLKVHKSDNPAVYANDMKKDYGANEFRIPDDHVGPLKEYLNNQIRKHEALGDSNEAKRARLHLSRVTPIGFTFSEANTRFDRATRVALRERDATYVSLGAASVIAFGPEILEILQAGSATDMSAMRMMHAGSVIAAERATFSVLGKYKTGALRGGLKGNMITGSAILLTDTAFSVYEHGGKRAFGSQSFYTNLGGSIGALAIGMGVGVPVTEVVTVATGGNVIAGVVTGLLVGGTAALAGQIGGQAVTQSGLEMLRPEFIRNNEEREINNALGHIQNSIAQLQKT